jgi:hypothetical protein
MAPSPIFTIIPILIACGFVLVLGAILFTIIRSASQAAWNSSQPVQTVAAAVIAKRQDVRGSSGPNMGGSTWTTYYCTFELEGGERREFRVGGREYGLLAEGDRGTLSYQGTRFISFDRRTGS